MAEKDTIIIDGYSFSDIDAVEVAKKEENAVAYLRENVDFRKPEATLSVYQKLVHQKVFHTVIGLTFLKELQKRLLAERQVPNTLVDPIPADPLIIKDVAKEPVVKKRSRKDKEEAGGYREKFIAAVVVCVVLLITVGVMFALAFTSNSPNIINYKTQIENEYASWEEDLKKREREVIERENALAEGQSTDTNESVTVEDITDETFTDESYYQDGTTEETYVDESSGEESYVDESVDDGYTEDSGDTLFTQDGGE
ncbi:MAG: hypothetical protein K6F00_03025 [Lachnospiraceae bacterium]|nr:hypothetical protein [Lachnospiraceae bacterium]